MPHSERLSVIENVLSMCSGVQPTDNAFVLRNDVRLGNSSDMRLDGNLLEEKKKAPFFINAVKQKGP